MNSRTDHALDTTTASLHELKMEDKLTLEDDHALNQFLHTED